MNYKSLYIHNRTIAKSINEARENMRSNTKCVAIYLDGRRVVSIGINKTKTHPLLIKFGYNTCKYYSEGNINDKNNKRKRPQYPIHAELDGYIKLLNSGADYNALLLYRGDNCDMASTPCYACANWLKKIDNLMICYISTEGQFINIPSNELVGHHRRLFEVYETFKFDDNGGNE